MPAYQWAQTHSGIMHCPERACSLTAHHCKEGYQHNSGKTYKMHTYRAGVRSQVPILDVWGLLWILYNFKQNVLNLHYLWNCDVQKPKCTYYYENAAFLCLMESAEVFACDLTVSCLGKGQPPRDQPHWNVLYLTCLPIVEVSLSIHDNTPVYRGHTKAVLPRATIHILTVNKHNIETMVFKFLFFAFHSVEFTNLIM